MPRLAPGRWSGKLAPAAALTVAVTLAGCAGPLPFRPERQPFGATISAAVRLTDDRLQVEIDTEGYRVERAVLVLDGSTEVAPAALVPSGGAGPSGGLSIGLGVGAGSWGSRGGYSVGTGIGIPVGGSYPRGTTLAVFRRDEAGPPPWRLRVKVVGVEPVDVILDPARPGA
ncbi:MAG TPA: hypothetical protein VHF87_06680 [Methylomirabilota bacterium]|jgi:hypothetical protein|nr:hypothetical protein [Methylomirabilota bacterium]